MTNDSEFGRVVTMDSNQFSDRVRQIVDVSLSISRKAVRSGRFESCECPAILGPVVIDILTAVDVMRAKLDDHELVEYLTDDEQQIARSLISRIERIRGDLITLTRSGECPEDGVRVVIGGGE